MKHLLLLSIAFALGGCHEIARAGARPSTAKPDRRLYEGTPFTGDEARFEEALARRALGRNESVRMEDMP